MTETLLLLVVVIVYFFILIGNLVNYILTSLSLYSIADKRNISSAWTAWLPVANYWCIGSIVDYHGKLNNVNSYWRKAMLTLAIIGGAGFVASYVFLFVEMIGIASMSQDFEIMSEEALLSTTLGAILPFYFILLISAVVLGTASVCSTVCYYKIFEYLVPEKAIKYFLISMLVPFGLAGCLMKCKNSTVGVFQYAIPVVQPTAPPQDENQNYYTPEQFK